MSGEPPRASSYTREFLQRVKSSTWEKRYVLGAVFLGQFLSLCLCGTGVTSQLLVTDHDISVPTTQCFLNYLLLGLTFGVHFATKKRYMKVLKYNWWKYIVLGVVDVEANFLIVLAYRYTNLTSIQFSGFYAMGFCLVVLGIFIYNLRHPLEKKLKKRSEETRREKSIERMFSVATTKLESSTETGDMEWKVRRLLESSTGNSTSDSIGILSRSFQVKMPHYGGTPRATELKHTGSFSLSHYDSCREGPLPFWGGQNNRRDDGEEDHHHGNGYYGHRVRPRIEIEAGSDSVRFSQSVPMCGEGEREGEPEGKEERNYSRQRGVGEEEREPKKRRNSDSLTHPHPQQQRRRRGSREGTPANRKHRRRRNEALSSPHKARARSSDEEEEEETTGLMFSPDLVQDRVDTKATDTTGGGRGGFN